MWDETSTVGMSENGGIRNILFAPSRRIRGPVVGLAREAGLGGYGNAAGTLPGHGAVL